MSINRRRWLSTVPLALLTGGLSLPVIAQRRDEWTLQALEFLESLDSNQRAQALLPFNSGQRRDPGITYRGGGQV
ncbi:MAG: hypothetical protein R3F37_15675 [Candidatus Competibacteraceae bacterium]